MTRAEIFQSLRRRLICQSPRLHVECTRCHTGHMETLTDRWDGTVYRDCVCGCVLEIRAEVINLSERFAFVVNVRNPECWGRV